MVKEKGIEAEGSVLEALPNATFRVELEGGHKMLAHLSGKMKIHFVKVVPGDSVVVEMSPYSTDLGRIVFRGTTAERDVRKAKFSKKGRR